MKTHHVTEESSETPAESKMRTVLTVAGSDSGGGAGIQADLKTFTSLGLFGTSVITCLTAQNPLEVREILPVDPGFVAQQMEAVCDVFPIFAMKTGMLYSKEIIEVVAAEDIHEGIAVLVVDPVMVSSSGARLLRQDAIQSLMDTLFPVARVITPNIHEAEILWGHGIGSVEDMRLAARKIGDRFDVACVLKGGHLEGDAVTDVLYDEGEEYIYTSERVPIQQSHGTGCTFSAALTAYLAQRRTMADSVELAKEYVINALDTACRTGIHHPLNFFEAGERMAHTREQRWRSPTMTRHPFLTRMS